MTHCGYANYDFNSLNGWNGLFIDFRKSTDPDNEKKMVWYEKYIEKSELSDIALVGTLLTENFNSIHFVYAKYDSDNHKDRNGVHLATISKIDRSG